MNKINEGEEKVELQVQRITYRAVFEMKVQNNINIMYLNYQVRNNNKA